MHLDEASGLDVAALGGEPTRSRDLRSRGRETVARLLRAGTEAVEERGHDNARVDDIVERADVSHGTFYLYFRDREDLLSSLVRLVAESVRPLGDELPRVADADALASWIEQAEVAFDSHVEVLRAAQSLGDDGAHAVLVGPVAAALEAAGGTNCELVATMLMRHFADAIVRADIIDAAALATVALRGAGLSTAAGDAVAG